MKQEKIGILIVEDEAIVAIDIEQGIKSSGYEVLGVAASGKDAIALAEKERPDLILMDIRLQGKMTGIEAAEVIREKFGTPVIFLTAHSDDATIKKAKASQPFGYLLKPFGVRELRASIEMALFKAEADRKISESEKWNRSLIQSAPSAFVAMDSKFQILDWNPFAESTFGWTKSESLGKSFFSHVLPERLRNTYREWMERFLNSKNASIFGRTLEQYGLTKDGNEIPIEITLTAIQPNGDPKFFAFINDISKRRQYEIQRSRASELERSNRDLERFAHLASHDLQEPLRTMSLYAQLLESKLIQKISPDEKQMLDHIIKSSRRMSALVEELLNYSRVGTSESFQLAKIQSEGSLKNAIETLSEIIKSNQATVEYGKLPSIQGNSVQIEQLFQNLLNNAIKFKSQEPPKISISAVRIGEFWRFLVEDNGVGFEKRYSDQIFEMFKRVHQDRAVPGTGAGLAICKKIVSLHGGRMWAESEPGKGSKFFFTLPATEPVQLQGALTGMKLLVVDDAFEARTLISHLLNGTGAVIDFTDDGFKAIEKLKAEKFDLVLMDIEMPSMSGIETALRVKQSGIQTPVIAFTNSNLMGVKEKAPEETFADYISKSMPPKLLIQHLHLWYAQKGSAGLNH